MIHTTTYIAASGQQQTMTGHGCTDATPNTQPFSPTDTTQFAPSSTSIDNTIPTSLQSPIIRLQVGELQFTVMKDTLVNGSSYFEALFSGRWPESKLPDGCYFLDADGDVFKHILGYLRHGVFPLLWSRENGFDLSMYCAIATLAEYLLINPLAKWVKDRTYLDAVTSTRKTVVAGESFLGLDFMIPRPSNTYISSYPSWETKRIYLCPRRIAVHRDNPHKCGKACGTARGDEDDEYETELVLKVVEIWEMITIDETKCSEN